MLSMAVTAFGAYSIKTTNYVCITQKRPGQDYKSPEMMITDVAAECGFATSGTKQYGVGIDSYKYDEDL